MGFDRAAYLRALFAPGADMGALEGMLWAYQRAQNPVLRQFCDMLGRAELTHLPIGLFKHHALRTGAWVDAAAVFESSGTTGQRPARHHVRDLGVYAQAARLGWLRALGPGRRQVLALLPSYVERQNASLVQMVQLWMGEFGLPGSGFWLHDFAGLRAALGQAAGAGRPVLLIGVAFALLDFVAWLGGAGLALPPDCVVMETGGMKGRRVEPTRGQLHEALCRGLGVGAIASEYGMTELLSQAYSASGGVFWPIDTLRVSVRDPHWVGRALPAGQAGRICVVDLANVDSCAFIATDDVGRMLPGGGFEVLGRMEAAELRGCSLMVA